MKYNVQDIRNNNVNLDLLTITDVRGIFKIYILFQEQFYTNQNKSNETFKIPVTYAT